MPECTLRASLQENNANDNGAAVVDTIDFDIPGSGVRPISPMGALPEITEPVTIDGYTQPGAMENTKAVGTNAVLRIELDGTFVSSGSGLDINASNSAIRGLVINRFGDHGIQIDRCITDGHKIEGNFIGTDPGGTQNLGNDGNGVVACSGSTTVGGTSPAARNLISGNGVSGVIIGGPGSVVRGNLIGTTKDGTTPLGNRDDGVRIVGPSSTVAGNTIAFNILGAGVKVVEIGEGTRANSILSNSIFSNGELGIDLDGNGVTANDAGDADTGTNDLQNYPVITRATTSRSTGRSVVRGTLNSAPTTTFTIQLLTNPAQDPSGFGEGQRLVRTLSVRTDASGNASFGLKARKFRGFISATATNDATGDTSEFSKAKKVIRTR
ncbi:MAG: hypothetical protein M3N33_09065 [Actinomycetota bacterium]|nr:hypothetical protein [Actinomycetota bacterium]